MKKTILITGSGVLGAYLAKEFLRKDYKVYVTSRFYKKKYSNYEYLKISNRIKFLKLDIMNKNDIKKLINRVRPVKIFYFSGQAISKKS